MTRTFLGSEANVPFIKNISIFSCTSKITENIQYEMPPHKNTAYVELLGEWSVSARRAWNGIN